MSNILHHVITNRIINVNKGKKYNFEKNFEKFNFEYILFNINNDQ